MSAEWERWLSRWVSARRWWLAPRPTAVFASNDAMAIGALSAFREAGLRVPRDIAVAGFDDIPIAGYVMPRLSSVHVPISDLGVRAMERLIEGVLHVQHLVGLRLLRQRISAGSRVGIVRSEPTARRSFHSFR